MTSREFAARLEQRATQAGLPLPLPALLARIETYYRLLMRWNSKMNLTALSLPGAPPLTLDRLIIEPLAAARHVPEGPVMWFDVGSGGGSPAIPLKIVRGATRLTMVEAKSKKAAFLREAVRELQLADTIVEAVRFEELAEDSARAGRAQLVTVRGVRATVELLRSARVLLDFGGALHMYVTDDVEMPTPLGFEREAVHPLAEGLRTKLVVYRAQQRSFASTRQVPSRCV